MQTLHAEVASLVGPLNVSIHLKRHLKIEPAAFLQFNLLNLKTLMKILDTIRNFVHERNNGRLLTFIIMQIIKCFHNDLGLKTVILTNMTVQSPVTKPI